MSIPDHQMAIYILHDLHITLTQAKILCPLLLLKSALKVSVTDGFQQQAHSLAQCSQQRASSLHLTGKLVSRKHIV